VSSPAESIARIRPLGKPGDLGWVVMAHGEQYAADFGWEVTFEALGTGIVGGFARTMRTGPQRGWIAEKASGRAGCVLCTEVSPTVGQLRPAGFVLTGEEPHHSFGVHSVGQTYDLDLQPVPAPVPETRA